MVHVRVEKQVKEKAAKALAAMGLSVSDVVRIFLTRVAAEQALPFALRVPNAKKAKAAREAHEAALREIEALIISKPQAGTPDSDRLKILVTLVEHYEKTQFPIPLPDPLPRPRRRRPR